MSESSSDSESSCGWTIINHEGSDVEVLSSDKGEAEGVSQPLSDQQLDKPFELQAEETGRTQLPVETLSSSATLEEKELLSEAPKEKLADDSTFIGATSDDSDIVTLEPPPVEDLQAVQEEPEVAAEEQINDDELNLGSSSSSQYTFAPPETVSAIEESRDESSSDETSGKSSPTLRRRRIRKKTMSSSETEEKRDEDALDGEQQQQQRHRFNTTLNKCILLALVIAFSMGFGHFYGTTQIQEQQKMVKKIHEDELNDVKDDLFHCQKDQAGTEESLEDLKEKPDMLLTLTELMDKMRKENAQLKEKQAELQVVCFQRNSSPGHHQQFQLWSPKKDLGTERERNTTMKPQEWKRKFGRGDEPQYLEGRVLAREKSRREQDNQDRLELWLLDPWEINLRKSQFHKHRKQTQNSHQEVSKRKITGCAKKKRICKPCQNKEKKAHSLHQNFQKTHTINQKKRKRSLTLIKKKTKPTKYAIKSEMHPQNPRDKLSKKNSQYLLYKNRKDQKLSQKCSHKKTHHANQRICNISPNPQQKPYNIRHRKRKQPMHNKENPCLPKDSCKKAHSASHTKKQNRAHHSYHKETRSGTTKIQTKSGKGLQHSSKKRKRPTSAKKAQICPKKPRKEPAMSVKKSRKNSQYLTKQKETKLQHPLKKKQSSTIIKSPHHLPKQSQKRINVINQKSLHKQAHKARQLSHKIRNKN